MIQTDCPVSISTKYGKNIYFFERGGFTLIELSIVLVIIGLIVGSVIVGRDLIKASEIRAQIKQLEEFKTAANSFRLKYGYLPADIPPSETAQLGFFTYTGSYAGKQRRLLQDFTLGYLNHGYGDNDGNIGLKEKYVFWQHLSQANMIAGKYGGSAGEGNYLEPNTDSVNRGSPAIGFTDPNVMYLFEPQKKLPSSNNLINLSNRVSVIANYLYTKMPYFNSVSTLNLFMISATPNQEFSIDGKIDDGTPDAGMVREVSTGPMSAPNPLCITATSPMAYNLASDTADQIDNCNLGVLW